MMFVPQQVIFVFLIIFCVGFFGIYIPWNERKKKGKAQKKKSPQPRDFQREPASVSARLEQWKTLKEAGLMDEREYQEKRKDILRDL